MRSSRLLLVTLRDEPAEAEIISHKLLLRAGFIRRVSAGVYAYLPLMWRVLRKVSAIVREEMDTIGALETLLPQLQPAELWRGTPLAKASCFTCTTGRDGSWDWGRPTRRW
jgi:prolyl-tRNA synthetase